MIKVKNPQLGVVVLDLIKIRHGEWTYELRSVNGQDVFQRADAEPLPKTEAIVHARHFGKNCQFSSEFGYHLP